MSSSKLFKIVLIPNSVTSIRSYAFKDCSNLRIINIPLNVNSFGDNVFEGCKMLQCGLIIENETIEYKDMLINTARLPEHCFERCILKCTSNYCQYHQTIVCCLIMLMKS